MARLLIKAENSTNTDTSKVYARGDVVVVMEDSHEWGGMEGLPNFLQLDIPNIPASNLLYLADMQEAQQNESISLATRKIQRMFLLTSRQQDRTKYIKNQRRFNIDVDSLPFASGRASVESITTSDKRKN